MAPQPVFSPPPYFGDLLKTQQARFTSPFNNSSGLSSPEPEPTDAELAVWEQAALAFVNEQRLARDDAPLVELPEGIKESKCECVLAKALPIVDRIAPTVSPYCVQVGTTKLTPSASVQKFIKAFDDGHYPDLEQATL